MEAAVYTTMGAGLIAFMSGLAYLAVQYPATYNVYGKYGLLVLGGGALIAMGHSAGVNYGASAVRPFVKAESLSASYEAIQSYQEGSFYLALGFVAFGIYLFVLAKISVHIYENERRGEGGDDQPE